MDAVWVGQMDWAEERGAGWRCADERAAGSIHSNCFRQVGCVFIHCVVFEGCEVLPPFLFTLHIRLVLSQTY